jgi:membrane peptidoglycan carboxypeptidase
MSTWRPIRRLPRWLQWIPAPVLDVLRKLAWLSLAGLVVFSGIAFFYFLLAMRFDIRNVERLPSGTLFYDRNGVEIDTGGRSGRRLVTRKDIPDFLVQALQAREDARFFQHNGVDVRGLARATVRNIKDRDFTQGASTLSMQLARNTFDIREKSIHRKLLEIAITLRIEARYSKDEILTHYLNRIYYGAGADGIEQAARTYFGKSSHELTDSESALLVGIIRGPHIFSPFRNLEKAIEQRNQTLARMVDAGLLTEIRRAEISAMEIKLVDENDRQTQASYALLAAQRELESVLDEEALQLGGLHVVTTLDVKWQQRIETELEKAVHQLESEKSWKHPLPAGHAHGTETAYVQYAAITTETKSGAVLALIGGRDFSHSRLDRTHARRDLGSAFEPFIAAAAAERGKLILPGRPLQTGRQIGPGEVQRIARRCGINGPFVDSEDLFRGAVAATPREMSLGLATLGNSGKRPRMFFIREVRKPTGEVIYQAKPDLTQVLGENAARDAATVLDKRGGTRCFTGATASEREAWTLRLGPSGSTAIWIGFDKPTAIAPEPRLKLLLDEFVERLGND